MEHWDPDLPDEAIPRLNNQCWQIVDLLRAGDQTNAALSAISLKYTSRNSDLRMNGFDVDCYYHNKKTGEAWYHLHEPPRPKWLQQAQGSRKRITAADARKLERTGVDSRDESTTPDRSPDPPVDVRRRSG